jgi:hypothetical protein
MFAQEIGCGTDMSCRFPLSDRQEGGIWDRLRKVSPARRRGADRIDWSRVIRRFLLHLCYGIGQKTGSNPNDRARLGSKHHPTTKAQAILLALIPTDVNQDQVTQTAARDRRHPDNSWQAWSIIIETSSCAG